MLNHKLLHHNWYTLRYMNVNESYAYLVHIIETFLNEFCPYKEFRITTKNYVTEPWVSIKLLKYTRKCKRLFNKTQGKSSTSKEVEHYLNYRRTLNRLKRYCKRTFYKDLFTKIGKNTKNLWSVLNGLLRKLNNKSEIVSLIVDGNEVSCPSKLPNLMNQHFTNIGTKTQSKIRKIGDHNYIDYVNYNVRDNMLLSPTSDVEITKIINNMQSKLSRGYDDISNKLLKRYCI